MTGLREKLEMERKSCGGFIHQSSWYHLHSENNSLNVFSSEMSEMESFREELRKCVVSCFTMWSFVRCFRQCLLSWDVSGRRFLSLLPFLQIFRWRFENSYDSHTSASYFWKCWRILGSHPKGARLSGGDGSGRVMPGRRRVSKCKFTEPMEMRDFISVVYEWVNRITGHKCLKSVEW
jgi:hypothetical protein